MARALDIALGKNPQATFNDLCETVLKPYDGELIYSSISPRIFEAASLKTPQILFPGWYNGLIKPGIHYFQLEKDFSNFDEMVKLLKDDCSLSELAENAYQDLIASELYDKKSLGSLVNQELENSMSLNSFASSSEPRVVEEAIEGIEKNYKYAKIFLNVTTEISFGVQHVLKVLRNPRYKGIRKFKRLYEILLRYCTHLKPRLVRN